jgi:hypothetical protein
MRSESLFYFKNKSAFNKAFNMRPGQILLGVWARFRAFHWARGALHWIDLLEFYKLY